MSINKDQIKGRLEEAAGTIKQATGKLVGDESLEAEGGVQKSFGQVRQVLGDVKQTVQESLKSGR